MDGRQTQLLLSEERTYSERFEVLLDGFCRKYSVSKATVIEAISNAFKHGR